MVISPRLTTVSPMVSSPSFTPTVPPELGGKGAGSALVKGALDQVRAEGLKVIPQCPFVKAYIDKHPEYADLLKG